MNGWGQGRTGAAERWAPLAYFALALLLAVFALPTVLRPPQSPPTQSAELSPDAPADEDAQQSIISSLNRANSTTAGAVEDSTGQAPAVTAPAPPSAPRACPRGVGDPARQVASLYSAPCAAAFSGQNGGATYQGVTATEIRIAYLDRGGNSGVDGTDGMVREGGTSAGDRQLWAFQEYMNRNFQLWGRRIQLYVAEPTSVEEPDVRAAVVTADEEYEAFAVMQHSSAALTEAARRKMVGIGGFQMDAGLYERNQPYLYSWWMDGTRLMRLQAEYLCKRLAGRPARNAGDDATRALTRKFGVLAAETTTWGASPGPQLPGIVKEMCGEQMESALFGAVTDVGGMNAALTRFRSAGVTTIIPVTDVYTTSLALSSANATGYNPEWIVSGFWEMDMPLSPTLFAFDRNQWGRAFGLSPMEMARPQTSTDWYAAYKEIDPSNEPDIQDDGPFSLFYELLQLANGIQRAGPVLTPETFKAGLLSMPKFGNGPVWSHAGGYAPGDLSYIDDVAELYFDPNAPNPWGTQWLGAYRYTRCGARWGLGEIPAGEPDVFNGGCTQPQDL